MLDKYPNVLQQNEVILSLILCNGLTYFQVSILSIDEVHRVFTSGVGANLTILANSSHKFKSAES